MITFDFNNPARWNFEGAVYLYNGSEETMDFADDLMRDMAEYNGVNGNTVEFFDYTAAMKRATPDSRFATKTTCDHCGAHFHYGAMYESDTGEVAIVGNICASNKLNLTAHEYADAKLRSLVKAARSKIAADKAEASLAKNRRDALSFDHYISRDIRSKFRKWHNCSVKQWALIKKIAREGSERAARIEEDKKTAVAIPAELLDGRHTIKGEILVTKFQASMYGDVLKMLIKDERGFKVWGTAPNALWEEHTGSVKGMIVEFNATVEVSDDDETFGFYKRPTKVNVISVPEEGD
jgi:hypothetical protein